jgi:phenylacetate-CoA ligase
MQALTKALKRWSVGDAMVRRNPLFYGDARATIQMLGNAGLEARQAWTEERLGKLLWIASRCAYGRSVGGNTQLDRWPLLQKEQVRLRPASFQASSRWLTIKASTGGTSGVPLQMVRSLPSVAYEQACIDAMIERLGTDARSARIAVLRGDNVKDPSDRTPPFWIEVAGGQRLLLSSNHLDVSTVRDYAAVLEHFKPDLLFAYPTSLESLCLNLRSAGASLKIARVLTSSEVLAPSVWQLAHETLNCHLLDYYGQAERVAFAYAQESEAYRFLPGYAHVELHQIDRSEEVATFEIVATSLWNFAMPLPRYRTGDLVRLPARYGAKEIEEISLGVRTFPGVLGRDRDVLISPTGAKLTGIDHFQRDVANLVRIQVIQETLHDVRILVLAERGFGADDERQLLNNVRSKLPDSMNVQIERTEKLERTAAFKIPFVIHRKAVADALRASEVQRSA